MSISKLDLGGKNLEDIFKAIEAAKFTLLPLTDNHFIELSKLPAHHRDPFDRILIAQSVAENLTLITTDNIIPKYPVKTVW